MAQPSPSTPPPAPSKPPSPKPETSVRSTELPIYSVEDLNASHYRKNKTHEIRVPQPNGKVRLERFTFEPDKQLKMAQDLALIFLGISDSFRVRNSRGQIVRPRSGTQAGERTVVVKAHEVVVPLTYVLAQELFNMARELPGGKEKFPDRGAVTHRADLEEFIIAGGTIAEDGDDIDSVAA